MPPIGSVETHLHSSSLSFHLTTGRGAHGSVLGSGQIRISLLDAAGFHDDNCCGAARPIGAEYGIRTNPSPQATLREALFVASHETSPSYSTFGVNAREVGRSFIPHLSASDRIRAGDLRIDQPAGQPPQHPAAHVSQETPVLYDTWTVPNMGGRGSTVCTNAQCQDPLLFVASPMGDTIFCLLERAAWLQSRRLVLKSEIMVLSAH